MNASDNEEERQKIETIYFLPPIFLILPLLLVNLEWKIQSIFVLSLILVGHNPDSLVNFKVNRKHQYKQHFYSAQLGKVNYSPSNIFARTRLV